MIARRKMLFSLVAGVALSAVASMAAYALPALQLGPGSGAWVYDGATQTWVTSGPNIKVNASANDTTANGGNGAYAWDAVQAVK